MYAIVSGLDCLRTGMFEFACAYEYDYWIIAPIAFSADAAISWYDPYSAWSRHFCRQNFAIDM